MVEVFKTNVCDAGQGKILIRKIHAMFVTYKANFDLNDCDKILRVQSEDEINSQALIELLKHDGFQAEILQDEILVSN